MSERLTPDHEAAIRARLAAISKWPWRKSVNSIWGSDDSDDGWLADILKDDDLDFAIAAPTDIAALLVEIDALRAEMITVRGELLSGNQYAAATRMRGWQLDDVP